jgi:hypothetical protein
MDAEEIGEEQKKIYSPEQTTTNSPDTVSAVSCGAQTGSVLV